MCITDVLLFDREGLTTQYFEPTDWKFDLTKQCIVLQIFVLRKVELKEHEYLLAVGVPLPNEFVFQNLKQGDPIEITVDGYPLRKFDDFMFNSMTGKVTIISKLPTGNKKISIKAGDVSFRNY